MHCGRVGLHVGTVRVQRNTAHDIARGAKPLEVEGLAKALAARVMSHARGGQTLLTTAACDALGGAFPLILLLEVEELLRQQYSSNASD